MSLFGRKPRHQRTLRQTLKLLQNLGLPAVLQMKKWGELKRMNAIREPVDSCERESNLRLIQELKEAAITELRIRRPRA